MPDKSAHHCNDLVLILSRSELDEDGNYLHVVAL